MSIKIGIPRGLMYYTYYPLWASFFELLGAQVVVSSNTSKAIVDKGVKNTVDEACLPVKVYHGHVIDLIDKVDYIFLPRLISIYKNEYTCPKFCGLPEMVKHSIHNLPQVIDTRINFHQSRKDLYKTIHEVGSYVTKDIKKIDWAFEKAMEQHNSYKMKIEEGILPLELLEKKLTKPKKQPSDLGKILVLGHPYTIYDSFLSMNTIHKLREHQVEVITQDSFDRELINEKAAMMEKKMFWTFGRKLIGAGISAMEQKDIQGIVYLSSFGCGLDSVITEILERRIRRSTNIPFMLLTVDEHTGEAGIETRIEAFVDMIRWRDEKHESNLSSYGEYLYSR